MSRVRARLHGHCGVRLMLTSCVAAIAVGVLPTAAQATYLSPALASGTGSQQFFAAADPAFAGDGQWVAFQGTLNEPAGDMTGVWRRNLATGEVDLVSPTVSGTDESTDATGPSISANGQFVAFTTTAELTPAETLTTGCPEVYVRNMAIQPTPSDPDPAGMYTLAAMSTSDAPILFPGGCTPGSPTQLGTSGAQAAPGVALSADGSEVAFTVDSDSTLAPQTTDPGGPGCSLPAGATTCASQVAVRDLDSGTTTVVSVTPDGSPTPNGGAYPSSDSLANGSNLNEVDAPVLDIYPVPSAAVTAGYTGENLPASTAAISADGTTVAWMGTNVPQQVPSATDIAAGMIANGYTSDAYAYPGSREVEPLWRRISDGASASTVRLLAGAGLSFFGYHDYAGSGVNAPIEGGAEEQGSPGVPALDANGDEVAVTADAPAPSELPALTAVGEDEPLPADLYLVGMGNPGSPQVTPLTQIPNELSTAADAAGVGPIAISPDGAEVAFETARTDFALGSPADITPPTAYDKQTETWVVDVPYGTLELATSTYNGAAPDGYSGLLSLDDAGDLAIDSLADNLFFGYVHNGQTNQQSETYVLDRVPTSTAVATESLSAPAPSTAPVPLWTIAAGASARRDGTVLVRASVPGAGELSARATAQLPAAARPAHSSRIPFRGVGSAHRRVGGQSRVTLVVRLRRADRRFAERRHGLYARLEIRFSARGHASLSRSIRVTFRVRTRARSPHHAARRAAPRGSSR